jgi:hypothetical protein
MHVGQYERGGRFHEISCGGGAVFIAYLLRLSLVDQNASITARRGDSLIVRLMLKATKNSIIIDTEWFRMSFENSTRVVTQARNIR